MLLITIMMLIFFYMVLKRCYFEFLITKIGVFFSRDHYNHAEKKNFDIEPQDIAVLIELFGVACLFNTLT